MIVPAKRGRREIVLHEGGTGGFRAFAAVVPETGTAVVVLANQARGTGVLGLQIVSALG
jgi:CubicO group peptidase (beta-lactamase class C family)